MKERNSKTITREKSVVKKNDTWKAKAWSIQQLRKIKLFSNGLDI